MKNRMFRRVCSTAAISLLIGCTQTGNNAPSGSDRSDRLDNGYNGDGRENSRASEYDYLPRGVRRLERGFGDVKTRAPEDGHLYISDITDGRIVVDAAIRSGDIVRVEPDGNRITINGKSIYGGDLTKRNEHGIYFRQDRDDRYDYSDRNQGRGSDRPNERNQDNGPAVRIEEFASLRPVAFGRGDITYIAPQRGHVWVYDSTRRKVVYSSDVVANDRIVIQPARNAIFVKSDSRAAPLSRMSSDDNHEIYFKAR